MGLARSGSMSAAPRPLGRPLSIRERQIALAVAVARVRRRARETPGQHAAAAEDVRAATDTRGALAERDAQVQYLQQRIALLQDAEAQAVPPVLLAGGSLLRVGGSPLLESLAAWLARSEDDEPADRLRAGLHLLAELLLLRDPAGCACDEAHRAIWRDPAGTIAAARRLARRILSAVAATPPGPPRAEAQESVLPLVDRICRSLLGPTRVAHGHPLSIAAAADHAAYLGTMQAADHPAPPSPHAPQHPPHRARSVHVSQAVFELLGLDAPLRPRILALLSRALVGFLSQLADPCRRSSAVQCHSSAA